MIGVVSFQKKLETAIDTGSLLTQIADGWTNGMYQEALLLLQNL
jgi:hypothetical protein